MIAKEFQYNGKLQIKIIRRKIYEIFFDFETTTCEYKHMPYLCWIYKDDIQHECVGINTCAVDMLNALPICKGEI